MLNNNENEKKPLISENSPAITRQYITFPENEFKDIKIKPLGHTRIALLAVNYFAYGIPILYALFLFINIYEFCNEQLKTSDNNKQLGFLFLKIFIDILTGIAATSDIFCNFLATMPASEMACKLSNKISGNKDNIPTSQAIFSFEETGRVKQSLIKKTLYITRFIGWSSFLIIGISGMNPFIKNFKSIYTKLALGTILIPTGFFYSYLLLADKIDKHHFFFLKNKFSYLSKEIVSHLKNRPSVVLEFCLQLLSNSLYKAITYAFIMAYFLEANNIENKVLNLSLIGIAGLSGFCQTVLTRTMSTKTNLLDTDNNHQALKLTSCLNLKFLGYLMFGLTRTTGISYMLWNYLSLPKKLDILTTCLVAGILVLHSISFSLKQNQNSNKLLNNHSSRTNKFINTINFFARSLRIASITVFIIKLAAFTSKNGLTINISNNDAIFSTLALLGIEANNFYFYNMAMKQLMKDYWGKKLAKLPENYPSLGKVKYLLFHGIDEIPEITSGIASQDSSLVLN